jgi:hypothetical protein
LVAALPRYVVLRLLPAVYQRIDVPDHASEPEKAEAFAAEVARGAADDGLPGPLPACVGLVRRRGEGDRTPGGHA